MAQRFDTLAALLAHGFDTLIDARAPAEFAEDHLPGAINLPVLSNTERAKVGTIYKQQSPFLARKVGGALVARNVAEHIEGPLAERDGAWRPLVYCWRGGQRSGSFVTILAQIGWRAEVLDGGYRSYRRLVKGLLYDAPWPVQPILLDGNTGTAKTDLLHLLAERGIQTIDLEGLAGHRGSVLGAMTTQQPSQKAFETALAAALTRLDPARPVVLEAESNKIGTLSIPPTLWAAMGKAPRIEISAPLEARARYLTESYADMIAEPDALAERLQSLIKLQGHDVVAHWIKLIEAGAFTSLAEELMAQHYDPAYARSRGKRSHSVLGHINAERLDAQGRTQAADQIAELILRNGQRPHGSDVR